MGLKLVSTSVIWQLSAAEIESISRDKRLTNSNGDNSLEGLDIDWHLAEFDYPATPISRKADVQSSHVYA